MVRTLVPEAVFLQQAESAPPKPSHSPGSDVRWPVASGQEQAGRPTEGMGAGHAPGELQSPAPALPSPRPTAQSSLRGI